MGLSADEQKLLNDLTARASEPDADENWEIEIFSGDKGARIPFSKGKDWLFREFGIGEAPAAAAGQDTGADAGADGKGPARQAYFGKRAAGDGKK